MAKKKTKEYVIVVHCSRCSTPLYRYRKEGPGHLVKCFLSNIIDDYTKKDLKCPKCETEFARTAMIHGRPAHKMIGGKVTVVGHHG